MKMQRVKLWILLAVLSLLVALPHTALAAPGDQYEVVGAGSTAVNGVYTWVADGKYTFVNGATTYYLCNNNAASPTVWSIADAEFFCSMGGGHYRNNSSSLTPPETGWQVSFMGSSPAPTVVDAAKGAKIEKNVTTATRLVQPGQAVTYTLEFTNNYTETITGVVISDTLAADLVNASFTSSGATVTARGGAPYVWDVQDLAAGQTGFITITAQVSGGAAEGVINNTAEITASMGGGASSAAFPVSWWQAIGPEDFFAMSHYGAQGPHKCRLALDSADVPYVACRRPSDYKAEVRRYTGGAWELVGAAGFSTGWIENIDLVLDSNNVPYVAFPEGDDQKATVMRYTGGAWEAVGSAGFSAGEAVYVVLALDSNNIPYVAYMDAANSNKVTVMRYNSGSGAWELVGSAGFSADIAQYISLALDSNNIPYVAYMDGGNSNKATVMRYNSGSGAWEAVGSAGFSAGQASYTSLALDSNNVPYVAYRDGGNSNKATVMRYTGAAWEAVGSAGFSAGSANYTSLALDSHNIPYVAYSDGSNSSKATVMRYANGAWETVGIPGFSADYAYGESLVLDSTNRPYVLYYNGDDEATVMRHPALPTSVTYTGITAGTVYTFGTGCGGVVFTTTGSVDAITLTAQFGYPTALGGGLPRRYDIVTHGGGVYEAQVRLCYEDDDLTLAGIPAGREGDLHAYQFTGGGWVEHSSVDTVNNIVTADNITNLDQVWGLGIPENQPTAVALRGLAARGGLWGMGAVSVLAVGLVLAQRRKRA